MRNIIWVAVLLLSRAKSLLCQEPGNWYTWETGGGRYYFSWDVRSWTDARTTCQSMGGDLVAISSEEENTFLENTQETGNRWIGLSLSCTGTACANFEWLNGETGNFADWYSSSYPLRNSGYNYVYKVFEENGWQNRLNNVSWPYVCEFTDGCMNDPCGVNEQCVSEQGADFSCVHIVLINECDSNPCVHGECLDGVGNYSCICESGYEGLNCQLDINECQNDYKCVTGSCTNIDGGYRCNCPTGHYGEYCQYDRDECESNNCLNGRCVDGSDAYTCSCNSGYTGVHCENDIDECQIQKMCVHGKCKNTPGGYKCECDGQYQGQKCNTGSDVSKTAAITAAILALFVTVCLVVAIIVAIRCYRKHKKPKNTPPVKFDSRRNDYVATTPNRTEPSAQVLNHGFNNGDEQSVYENAPTQEVYTGLTMR